CSAPPSPIGRARSATANEVAARSSVSSLSGSSPRQSVVAADLFDRYYAHGFPRRYPGGASGPAGKAMGGGDCRMTEHEDEEVMDRIASRIGRGRLLPDTPANIEEAARRIAALIAEYPLRYRNVVEIVKSCASTFYAVLTGVFPEDRG